MTNPTSTAALAGVELAEKCAELMGGVRYKDSVVGWIIAGKFWVINDDSPAYISNNFRPDTDERHAAELRRWATNQWGVAWEIIEVPAGVSVRASWRQGKDFGGDLASGIDLCVPTCRVFIAAAEALRGSSDKEKQ